MNHIDVNQGKVLGLCVVKEAMNKPNEQTSDRFRPVNFLGLRCFFDKRRGGGVQLKSRLYDAVLNVGGFLFVADECKKE